MTKNSLIIQKSAKIDCSEAKKMSNFPAFMRLGQLIHHVGLFVSITSGRVLFIRL